MRNILWFEIDRIFTGTSSYNILNYPEFSYVDFTYIQDDPNKTTFGMEHEHVRIGFSSTLIMILRELEIDMTDFNKNCLLTQERIKLESI